MPTKPFPFGTKVTGRVDYTVEFATNDLAAACKCFRTLFPNGRIEKIGDRDFVAQCENCDKPIFDGDEYSPSGDCYLCKECAAAEAEEDRDAPTCGKCKGFSVVCGFGRCVMFGSDAGAVFETSEACDCFEAKEDDHG